MQILRYELIKIFSRKSSILSLLGLFLCSVLIIFNSVSDATYVYSDGSDVKGMKALTLLKTEKMKWNGQLTEAKIKKVIDENSAINNKPEYVGINDNDVKLSNMNYAEKQGFMDIKDLINRAYGEFRSYDYYLIDSLKPLDAKNFYQNRINQLKTWLSSDDSYQLNEQEKNYLLHSAITLSTPFHYSYADGWQTVLEYSLLIMYALFFAICILMAPVFSIEYQTGVAAIILTSEQGKKRGVVLKLSAGLLSISVIYFFTILLTFGSTLLLYGTEGANCQIQAYSSYFRSFYHVTNLQALSLIILLGYIACIFLGCLAMYLSARLKSSFASIIIIVVLVIFPSIINQFLSTKSFVGKFISLFPDQMLIGWRLLNTYTFYNIFGKVITPYHVLPFIYILLLILLLPLTYRSFQLHQTK